MLEDLEERIRDVRQGPDGLIYLLTDHPRGCCSGWSRLTNPSMGARMKITAVTPISIGQFLFVEIETDAGITGLGRIGHMGASRGLARGHRNLRRASVGRGPGAHRAPLEPHAPLQPLPGRSDQWRHRGDRHRALGHQGQGTGGAGPLPPRRAVPDTCQGLRPRLRQDHRRAGGELRCPQGGRLQRGRPYQPLPRRARGRAFLRLPCEPHEPRRRDRAPVCARRWAARWTCCWSCTGG